MGTVLEVLNAIIEIMEKHDRKEISLESLKKIRDNVKGNPSATERFICSIKQQFSNENKTAGNKRNG